MAIDEFTSEAIEKANVAEINRIINKVDSEARDVMLNYLDERLSTTKKDEAISEIRQIINSVDPDLRNWISNSITESYATGFNATSRAIGNTTAIVIGGEQVAKKLTPEALRSIDDLQPHRRAVNSLISDTYLDFANGMNGVQKAAERQINSALKRQIRAEMISGQLRGKAMEEISEEVQELLGDQGFSVLIDRGGNRWSLQRYSEMLTRTHIIKSSNEGAINRAADKGVDLMQVSSHSNPCNEICASLEGNIYSISGESEKYPQMNIMLPAHPNCRHSWIPRPDLEE